MYANFYMKAMKIVDILNIDELVKQFVSVNATEWQLLEGWTKLGCLDLSTFSWGNSNLYEFMCSVSVLLHLVHALFRCRRLDRQYDC